MWRMAVKFRLVTGQNSTDGRTEVSTIQQRLATVQYEPNRGRCLDGCSWREMQFIRTDENGGGSGRGKARRFRRGVPELPRPR